MTSSSIKKILIAVGARPNFIKITQFKKVAAQDPSVQIKIVHTGQHYDNKMADVFFEQFELIPDYFLNIPSASANTQIAEIMLRFETLVKNEYAPDLVIVVGDVNSTLAIALTANKLGIKLAHLESGLRSEDRTMPEEINRLLTDEISDYFFITEKSGYENLLREGKKDETLFLVGNTMIDTIVAYEQQIQHSDVLSRYGLTADNFVLMTMHRPATVDSESGLTQLLKLIELVTEKYKLIIPVHPRTLIHLEKYNLLKQFNSNSQIIATEPLDYFSFQKLILSCKFILTDSGGIQEESSFRKIPCFTLRPNTERPITCEKGTNMLVPFDIEQIKKYIYAVESGTYKKGSDIPFWDGNATQRIMNIISNL
jgi:UDP-N-acetylglucosamine 2-epimerase (non-hydrolysing)